MGMTLGEIAERIGGELVGDAEIEITGVSGIREAEEGDVTFLANPRYEPYLRTTRASAVIMSRDSVKTDRPVIYNDNPYLAFLRVVKVFFPVKIECEFIFESCQKDYFVKQNLSQ